MKRALSLVFLLASPALGTAQVPDKDLLLAPVRRELPPPDFQDQLNDVFGDVLGTVSYLPFYNIAPWFGLSTQPHLIRDADGTPIVRRTDLTGHQGAVQGIVFAPDGQHFLTYGADNAPRLWNVQGRGLTSLPHDTRVTAAAFFPDTFEITTGTADGHIVVWQLESRHVEHQLQQWSARELTDVAAHRGPIRFIGYSDDGEVLLTAADDRAVLWDLQVKEAQSLAPGAPVTAAALSPNGEHVLLGTADGTAALYDSGGARVANLSGDSGPVRSVAFGPEGNVLLVVAGSRARTWRTNGEALGSIDLAGADVSVSLVSKDEGVRVATPGATPGEHTLWTLQGERLGSEERDRWSYQRQENQLVLRGPQGNTVHTLHTSAPIEAATFGPDRQRIVTAQQDGTVTIWEWLVRDPAGGLVITSIPFVVLWLVVAAVGFTLYMKFVNVRMFGHAIHITRGAYDNPADEGEVSHFQALSSALSATVGLGNIAGVAIAIMVGGPGATIWMIVAGSLGMTLKFTECTLGQRYRKIDAEGHVSGGPMHYLRDGLRKRGLGLLGGPLSVIFMIFCIGGSLAGGNSFQVNQSLTILREKVDFFAAYPWVYGVIMAVLVGIVIIGGIRRIAQTAEKIVPTMCGIYVLASLVIIVFNLQHVPQAFSDMFEGAFQGKAIYGGAIGALIMGFRRAAFSNEAGVGSAAIAHSAARTPYPVREGIVALLEPFIDTVIVCTMTALVINITDVYQMPQFNDLVVGQRGAALTAEAFATVSFLAGWFPWVLMFAVVLFAFSTMISWSYYGERCWTNLFGPRSSMAYKLLFLVFVVLGSLITATNILEFGDLMILLMAFPNILGLYILGGEVKRELVDYEHKLRAGQFKTYK